MAALGFFWLLAGCVPVGTPTGSAPLAGAEQERVTQIAVALAQADEAARLGPAKRAELEMALIAVDALGAKPADGAGDPVPEWRSKLPEGSIATHPSRGRALGAAYRQGWVDAGATITVEQIFFAGQTAQAAVASPDNALIDLMVHGGDTQPLCTAKSGAGSCRWLPAYTRRYALTISNPGRARARYYLVVE
jgi:hypothetical protein